MSDSKVIDVVNENGVVESFENPSQLAKAALARTDWPLSAIASFTGITAQTVLRLDETHGIRRPVNPKYAPKK